MAENPPITISKGDNPAERHAVPGQHRYEEILYPGFVPKHIISQVRNLQGYHDDVILAGFPKSGNVWMAEMLYLISRNGDDSQLAVFDQGKRVPTLEVAFEWDAIGDRCIDVFQNMSSPRIARTHLPYRYVPKTGKIIYVVRNPKDTLVSFYHFYRAYPPLGHFKGSWDDFFDMHIDGDILFGNWFEYTKDFWVNKDQNMLIVHYEDMVKDHKGTIRKVAQFCGRHIDDDVISFIADVTSFGKMSHNPHLNFEEYMDTNICKFMRKGVVGDWKNHFSKRQSKVIDQLYEQTLKPLGMHFDFE